MMATSSSSATAAGNSRSTSSGLQQQPEETLAGATAGDASSFGAAWVRSFDERSVESQLVTRTWAAALEFFQRVHEQVEQAVKSASNTAPSGAISYPELHLTHGCHVRVVLSIPKADDADSTNTCTTSMLRMVDLAQRNDRIDVEYDLECLQAQRIMDDDDDDTDEAAAVPFNKEHFPRGLNGDFSLPARRRGKIRRHGHGRRRPVPCLFRSPVRGGPVRTRSCSLDLNK